MTPVHPVISEKGGDSSSGSSDLGSRAFGISIFKDKVLFRDASKHIPSLAPISTSEAMGWRAPEPSLGEEPSRKRLLIAMGEAESDCDIFGCSDEVRWSCGDDEVVRECGNWSVVD